MTLPAATTPAAAAAQPDLTGTPATVTAAATAAEAEAGGIRASLDETQAGLETDAETGPAHKRRRLSLSRDSGPAPATAAAPPAEAEPDEGPPRPDHDPRSDLELSLSLHERAHDHDLTSYPVSHYWDASTMAPLNAASAAALARLRSYKPPPFPTWDLLPVTRRAAVLVLLFADRRGDLRVVITMRAASLRNFSGHAAFPGGKADSLSETPYQIARREAWEEIGLPMDDSRIPRPFRIEPLCHLPCSLAKTELAVRPCVAFLHADDVPGRPPILVDETLIPRLDAKEVAAVFSAPLHNFLRATDELPETTEAETAAITTNGSSSSQGGGGQPAAADGKEKTAQFRYPPLPEGHWYDGRWTEWHGTPWRIHNFWVPVNNQRVTRPPAPPTPPDRRQHEPLELEDDTPPQRFLVWGLTGRMLVDTARVAYAEEPEFEHNAHYGDEDILAQLQREGRLPEKERRRAAREVGLDAVKDDVKDAKI